MLGAASTHLRFAQFSLVRTLFEVFQYTKLEPAALPAPADLKATRRAAASQLETSTGAAWRVRSDQGTCLPFGSTTTVALLYFHHILTPAG